MADRAEGLSSECAFTPPLTHSAHPSPDASLTQPLPAPDVHSPLTHSKLPGPQWPPAAGKLPAGPQGRTTDGTSTLHNTTDNRHHLKSWKTPGSPQTSFLQAAEWWHDGTDGTVWVMGVGGLQNTTHYPHQNHPGSTGIQLDTHLGWALPRPHPALPVPAACCHRGSLPHPCRGLLEEGRGEQLRPWGWAWQGQRGRAGGLSPASSA